MSNGSPVELAGKFITGGALIGLGVRFAGYVATGFWGIVGLLIMLVVGVLMWVKF